MLVFVAMVLSFYNHFTVLGHDYKFIIVVILIIFCQTNGSRVSLWFLIEIMSNFALMNFYNQALFSCNNLPNRYPKRYLPRSSQSQPASQLFGSELSSWSGGHEFESSAGQNLVS